MNPNQRRQVLNEEVEALENLVGLLRGPNGCPWDAKQTFQTVRLYLLEEAYEVVDAIDKGTREDICSELGDLLFQIFFLASIAEEKDQFKMSDIISGVREKMIRRHPHVFSDVKVKDADQVVKNWNEIKKIEYKTKNEKQYDIFAGFPKAYPALAQTDKILSKAESAAFSYDIPDNIKNILAPFLNIETDESEYFENEIGKFIFAVVALCQSRKVNAEDILRKTNVKFMDEAYREISVEKKGD